MPPLSRHDRVGIADDTPSDEPSVQALCQEEAPGLVQFFRRQTGSHEEAEDLAQEALARFCRASRTTRIETPRFYLRRIATNLLRDRAELGTTRLAKVSVPLSEGLEEPASSDPHRDLVGRQELAHFDEVLRQLKPKTLRIFLLSRVDGYTYKEIARSVGITLFGVKWHMAKAIEHIDRHRRDR